MIELNPIQRQILHSLLFPETFATLLEEVQGSAYVIGAELKSLITKGLVLPMEMKSDGRYQPSIYYDTDDMHAFRYQISAKGIKIQEG